MVRLDVTGQNEGDDEQGLNTLEFDGTVLVLTGWFDDVATWRATVRLTPEQIDQLYDACS